MTANNDINAKFVEGDCIDLSDADFSKGSYWIVLAYQMENYKEAFEEKNIVAVYTRRSIITDV